MLSVALPVASQPLQPEVVCDLGPVVVRRIESTTFRTGEDPEMTRHTFRDIVNEAAVVENKRLGPVLAYIAERQKELDMSRSKKAPRRRGQGPSPFKVG